MIQIPQPCHKKWNDLNGTNRVKFCSSCNNNVYNLNQLSANDIQNIIQREEKVCGMLVKKNETLSNLTRLRMSIVGLVFFVGSVFGQQDSIQIKGKVNDLNGFPIMDSKITLKNFPIESFSNEYGEFSLIVPKNLKTYILEVKDPEYQMEIVYKEEELSQEIVIPLGNSEDLIIGEINYKPTFKQRVIHTITWPYRKIRSTFFND
ncbi:hypothetical protein [Faecalibacter bovis]|uniref:Carboxypeptidase-like regulatory domain-containing protein n=1 Tax=Faecalibacter bovis TaxID=2898187 RepID=A0ABX7XD02_9FLAO|nr:hypothetical protein [Faecalibacter bovis]QTV05791.1 hypothetical protein J9309_00080 [Faecalibacter bovis]